MEVGVRCEGDTHIDDHHTAEVRGQSAERTGEPAARPLARLLCSALLPCSPSRARAPPAPPHSPPAPHRHRVARRTSPSPSG
eukprot:1545814-Prymnesium_polylepis.1